jgi:hypothetical protein
MADTDTEQTRRDLQGIRDRLRDLGDELAQRQRVDREREREMHEGDAFEMNPLTPPD